MTDFSIQLYSARNVPPLEANLALVARLGYTQVEPYGGQFGDPAALAAAIKAAGLTAPTAHIGLDMLKDTSRTIDAAGTVGIKTIFCPAIPREDRSQDEGKWRELADTLARLAETYNKAGLGFGWHNHDFEFVPTAGGKLPMNILLDGAPGLEWEVDVAWLVRGGHTPAPWFAQYGKRITGIHVKDIAPEGEALDEDGWADVGYGTLDWPQLFRDIKANTSARYFVMEHDKPSDFERFARRSIETAREWK
ncbi:MAG TPA: sugar phosphate isomerase/epimerase [Devosia sp.]|jgi:sugar phosphate isomerase/epimerase|nr:sugar phosphate isomerase/epimerase [Devosia sp.]